MRHFGPKPDPGRRYTRRPGAYAMLVRGNAALMTLETTPLSGSEIQIPGGGIDPGETPLQALHREVMEETGWRIKVERRIGWYQRHTYMPDYDMYAHKICHIFLARPTFRIGPPLEPHHEVFWTDIDTAIALVTQDADRAFLEHNLARIC